MTSPGQKRRDLIQRRALLLETRLEACGYVTRLEADAGELYVKHPRAKTTVATIDLVAYEVEMHVRYYRAGIEAVMKNAKSGPSKRWT